MLLLASYFNNHTSLSTLLQRYVSGFGVGKCLSSEIEPATGGLIKLIDRKGELCQLLQEKGVTYRRSSNISINGQKLPIALKTSSPKVAILAAPDSTAKSLLEVAGWKVFDFESALDDTYYNDLLNLYI